jgi:glycosyltransferase involved in cell wall biosynthesis
LVPSTEPEPFGLVAVEAMLAGKPVIGANHGGLTEIVVHEATGLLVKPGDVVSLGEAMTFFITHQEAAARMGETGKERAHLYFSVQSYTRAFETLFERF